MSRMRALPRHLLAASLLLALVGCGDDKKDAAQALCDLHFSCDCEQTQFADVNECVTEINAELAELDDAAKKFTSANGLTFDQACVDQSRQAPADLSCDLDTDAPYKCTACAPIHGDQPLGAGCTPREEYSDCARDLVCYSGICVDPCQTLAQGDSCGQGSSLATCGEGLFCDANNTKKCQPTGGVGSPCPTGEGCDADLYCENNKTCAAPPKAGEPCGPFELCADELYCKADTTTCEPIPGDGEPCDVICQEHFLCDGGTCKSGPAIGEPCPAGVCAVGAECYGDTCVAEQAAVCQLSTEDEDEEG